MSENVMEDYPEGDWPEDFKLENGNYTCRCSECKHWFCGHKRRLYCKKCTIELQKQSLTEKDKRIAELESRLNEAEEILCLNSPFPLHETLRSLIAAANTLLHEKNYDGHGYELISYALDAAMGQFQLINEYLKEHT